MNLEQQLSEFEGVERKAYLDTRGIWTIGKGHTGPEVVEGLVWTDAQIDAAFAADVAEAVGACAQCFPWFAGLNEPRRAAVVGMVFQMGMAGVLKFVRTLVAIRDERWHQAAGEMLASDWAKQTAKRATRLARQIETGQWQ